MYVLSEVDPSFLVEVWTLYGIGMTVLFLRFAVRIRTVGFRGFKGDDFCAVILAATYTLDAVTVHNVYFRGTNVEGVAIERTRSLSQPELDQLREGSKQQLVAWYSYGTLVWCLKAIMLFFFKRMTIGLSLQRLVNWLAIICVLAYVAVIFTITFSCFPVSHNWQVVPDPGSECTLKPQNFYVMTVLNVLTDAGIFFIPLRLLWTLKVPLRQKLLIGILLSSGLFVISAALIRLISTLTAKPSALTINRWGVRETIVGLIAVNIPILRPLFTKAFWRPHSGRTTNRPSRPPTKNSKVSSNKRRSRGPYSIGMSFFDNETVVGPEEESHHGSQENIISNDPSRSDESSTAQEHKHVEGSVLVQTTFGVTSEERPDQEEQSPDRGFTQAHAFKVPCEEKDIGEMS